MNNGSFLRHAVVYGLANLLTQGAGFVLIPLYTRCLSKNDVGSLEILGRAAELGGTLLLVSGLKQGLMTLYQQKTEESERRRTAGSALGIVLLLGLVLSGIMLLLPQQLLDWLQLPRRFIQLSVLAVVLEPLHLLPLALMQMRLESTRLVIVTVAQFLTRILLCVLFVVGFGWGIAGILWATLVNGAVFGVCLSGREVWQGVAWPDWRRVRGLLKFALPFLPGGLCFFMLQQGDRFFLNSWCGKGEVAVYGIGYKLAQVVSTFSLIPLYMVWSSHLYTVAGTPESPVVFGRMFTRILAAFLFVALGLSFFEVEAVRVIGGAGYAAAVPIIAPVLLASFFQAAASLMDAAFYVCHRTGLKLIISVAATAVITVLYAVLIPVYHGLGAAFATLAGFAVLAILTWRATQIIFPVRVRAALVGDAGNRMRVLAAVAPAAADSCPGTVEIRPDTRLALCTLAIWVGLGRGKRLCSWFVPATRDESGVGTIHDGSALAEFTHGCGIPWRNAAATGNDCPGHSPAPVCGDNEMTLEVSGGCAHLFSWDTLNLLVRGYVRGSQNGPLDIEAVAQEIRCHYLEHNELAVAGLEGSFTLALLDSQAGRVILYRNLVGTGFTYYHCCVNGFLFSNNLQHLVRAAGATPRENLLALPTFFLYRFVPGNETLFDGFFRLLPGEEVAWDGRTIRRRQRTTFADLKSGSIPGDPVDAVEETMTRVLADCQAHRPGAANLLSGGVDSSYLQAVWNTLGGTSRSFSVAVDHPRSHPDTAYAVTAALALRTDHTLIPADAPYADYLLDLLSTTGEPPNHVQSAYFGHLARNMRAHGVATGLCGEGADSLFGVGLANQIHNARVLRGLLPASGLRQMGAAAFDLLGLTRLAFTCKLADGLTDFADLEHPVNRVAAFADWPAVEASFGREGIADAAAGRRALLDRLGTGNDPLDCLHAAGYLGEAADSASLWTTLFNAAGADLLCPFLDSRMLQLALTLPARCATASVGRRTCSNAALAKHVGDELAHRPKLGFGQPIFEWLAPGGQLRPLVESLLRHPFLDAATLQRVLRQPTWFLYSLLCYDLWHRLFIEQSLMPQTITPQRVAA